MRTRLVWAASVTGLLSTVGLVIWWADPAYYAPETFIDYVASVINDVTLLSAGVTMLVWSGVSPVRRARFLVLGAGIGFVVWTVGNILEEIMRLEVGETLYFVGSIGAFGLSIAAGIVTLTVRDRWRWSGLFLLVIAAGIGFEGIPLWPVAWLGFAYVLASGRFDPPDSHSLGGLSQS